MFFFQSVKKNKMFYIGKHLALARCMIFILVFAGVLTLSVPRAWADEWGSDPVSVAMTHTLSVITRNIEGALLASLKMTAMQALNSQVGQFVTGTTMGDTLFITNYDDFLYRAPAQRADLFLNDFFTLTTRGKAYSSNYIPAGHNGNFAGNYSAYLTAVGRQAALGNGVNVVNLDEYIPSPEQMFAEGDWRAFNAFFTNPANNPYGYALQTEQAYQQKLAMEQQQAMIKASTAGGYLPKQNNGMIVTPAGTIQHMVGNVTTLANQVIAAAQNPAELAAGVITAMANRVIGNLIQRGVGEVQANIQREIGNVDRAIFMYGNQQSQQFGASVRFIDETAQRTSAVINSATTPPPAYVGQ